MDANLLFLPRNFDFFFFFVNPLVPIVLNFGVWQKFYFQYWKGSSKKISYERRDYDSVDEKTLS